MPAGLVGVGRPPSHSTTRRGPPPMSKNYQTEPTHEVTSGVAGRAEQVIVAMAEIAGAVEEGLLALAVAAGFQVMATMMDNRRCCSVRAERPPQPGPGGGAPRERGRVGDPWAAAAFRSAARGSVGLTALARWGWRATRCSPRPRCWGGWRRGGCSPSCRRAVTRPLLRLSAATSTLGPRRRRSRRCRAGLSRPPSGRWAS